MNRVLCEFMVKKVQRCHFFVQRIKHAKMNRAKNYLNLVCPGIATSGTAMSPNSSFSGPSLFSDFII